MVINLWGVPSLGHPVALVFECRTMFRHTSCIILDLCTMFSFTELGTIIVVIVTNPMFILPWVHEILTIEFTKPL